MSNLYVLIENSNKRNAWLSETNNIQTNSFLINTRKYIQFSMFDKNILQNTN